MRFENRINGVGGTAVTAEELNKGNWRDDTTLSFAMRGDDNDPAPLADKTQIFTKPNGKTYLMPPAGSNGEKFELGKAEVGIEVQKHIISDIPNIATGITCTSVRNTSTGEMSIHYRIGKTYFVPFGNGCSTKLFKLTHPFPFVSKTGMSQGHELSFDVSMLWQANNAITTGFRAIEWGSISPQIRCVNAFIASLTDAVYVNIRGFYK